MKNHDIDVAWAYHNGTKHSVGSVRSNRHCLDWHNQPLPLKIYTGSIRSRCRAISAVERAGAGGARRDRAAPAAPCTARSARAGAPAALQRRHHAQEEYPGGQVMYFRAAACTGALYHIDLYVVCGDLPDLPRASIISARRISRCAGCGPATTARAGRCTADEPSIAGAPP